MTSDNRSPRFNTLTDRARYYTRNVTGTLGRKLHEMGVHPDAITRPSAVIASGCTPISCSLRPSVPVTFRV